MSKLRAFAIQRDHENQSRGIPAVWSHYLETRGEDTEALMFAVVICKECRLAIAL
jgi:hypothetical protein